MFSNIMSNAWDVRWYQILWRQTLSYFRQTCVDRWQIERWSVWPAWRCVWREGMSRGEEGCMKMCVARGDEGLHEYVHGQGRSLSEWREKVFIRVTITFLNNSFSTTATITFLCYHYLSLQQLCIQFLCNNYGYRNCYHYLSLQQLWIQNSNVSATTMDIELKCLCNSYGYWIQI